MLQTISDQERAGDTDILAAAGGHLQHNLSPNNGQTDGLVVPVKLSQNQTIGEGGEHDPDPAPTFRRVRQQLGGQLHPGHGVNGH